MIPQEAAILMAPPFALQTKCAVLRKREAPTFGPSAEFREASASGRPPVGFLEFLVTPIRNAPNATLTSNLVQKLEQVMCSTLPTAHCRRKVGLCAEITLK